MVVPMSPASRELVVGLELHAGLEFARAIPGQRRLRHDAPGQPQRIGGDLAVFGGAEVVGSMSGASCGCGERMRTCRVRQG
jgi:hypothetical protein